MKRILFISILAIICMVGRAQVLFDSYSYDFGQIREVDGVVSHTFGYKNEGKELFVILSASVSCGCTTPSYSTKALAAGASGEFRVSFDPSDRPGNFDKQIIIRSNQGIIRLNLTGVVLSRPRTVQDDYPFIVNPYLRFSALSVYVERTEIGRPLVRELGVANTSLALSASIAVDSAFLPSWLRVVVDQPIMAAGGRSAVRFIVEGQRFGLHQFAVPIMVNGKPLAEKVWVSATFTRDFSTLSPAARRDGPKIEFSSYFYHFSDRRVGEKLTRTFEVLNTGKADLVIDHIETSSSELTYTINKRTISAGARATLVVVARPSDFGVFSHTVSVISSDDQNPVRELRVMANVVGD